MRLQTRKRLVEELEDSIMQGSGQQRRLNQFGLSTMFIYLEALEFLYRTPRKSGFRSRSAILQSKNSQGLLFTSYESKHDIRARHARQKKSLLKAEPIMKLRNQQPIPYFTQLARVLTYNN